MAYVPNADTLAEPLSSREVASAAAEFIAIKAKLARTLAVPEAGELGDFPAVSTREGKYMYFGVGGVLQVSEGTGTTGDLQLRPDLLSSDVLKGPALVGFHAQRAYASGTLGKRLTNFVNITDFPFMAKFDNVQDDTAAWQAIINYVMAFSTEYRPEIQIPTGISKISANIVVPVAAFTGFTIRGQGKDRSQILCTGAVTRAFDFSAGSAPNLRFERVHFEGVSIDGNGVAAYGIYAPHMAHGTYKSFRIKGTTGAAIYLGYGFCSVFDDLEIVSNTGDGVDLVVSGGQTNASVFIGCKIYLNNGFGVKVSDSYGVAFACCTIEMNKKAGIFAVANSVIYVGTGSYFEANAELGHDFTVPTAVNIKADIIINGTGSLTTHSAAAPCTATIVGNFVSASYSNYFVYAPGGNGVVVENNALLTGAQTALVGLFGNNSVASASPAYGGPTNLKIGQNRGWTTMIDITPMGTGVLNYTGLNQCRIEGTVEHNLAITDLNWWVVNVAGATATTWQRSAQAFPYNQQGAPVWELTTAAAGTSDTYGFNLDAASYSKWAGKFIVFGMWTKHTFANDGNAALILDNAPNVDFFSADNDWVFQQIVIKWPAAGTIEVGIRKIGAAGTVYVAGPAMAELGTDLRSIAARAITEYTMHRTWTGSAAPTAGAWNRGDRIKFRNSAAGAAPGTYCVTAGSPGIWKNEAALAA